MKSTRLLLSRYVKKSPLKVLQASSSPLQISRQQVAWRMRRCYHLLFVHGAIGFGFVSHWLKNWLAIFQPITKRSNCNREISFNSHLKIGLTVGEPTHWLFCCMVCSHKKKLFFLKPVINPYILTAYHTTGDPIARITVRQLVSLWIVREKSYLAGQNCRKHPIIFKE